MGKRLDRPSQEVVKRELSSAKRTPDVPVMLLRTASRDYDNGLGGPVWI